MDAVAEKATEALTVATLWAAINRARRKHYARRMEVVLLTMHPRDLDDLRLQDSAMRLVGFDLVRNCWTAFGVPITERQMPGAASHRAIVLKREPLAPGRMPRDWQTMTVQDLNRIVTEEF